MRDPSHGQFSHAHTRATRAVGPALAPSHARHHLRALAVVFNLANKQCLNSWNHPWALATTHLAVGTTCMLPLWLPLPRWGGPEGRVRWVSVRARPSLTREDLRAILPVVAMLATGHVTSTLAPAYGTVAFSNIIKTAEPLFTCAFSVLLYRRAFPISVYASLLLVVCGVGLVSAREVNFSSFSLVRACSLLAHACSLPTLAPSL